MNFQVLLLSVLGGLVDVLPIENEWKWFANEIWGSCFVLRRLMNIWAHDKSFGSRLASFGILFFCGICFNLWDLEFFATKKKIGKKKLTKFAVPQKPNMFFLNVSFPRENSSSNLSFCEGFYHVSCSGGLDIVERKRYPKKHGKATRMLPW